MFNAFVRSSLIGGALALATLPTFAQSYTHQVVVLNEGYYNVSTQEQVVPVTLGAYDPAAGTYQTVATIDGARFGNHVLVADQRIYVAADQRLLVFDADTYQLLAEATVPGIRRFDLWEDRLVITLGEVGGLPHYCEVRDKNTLELDYATESSVLPYSCEAVKVVGDKAYVGINNAFDWSNVVGQVGVLNLATSTWEQTIDLGADGQNPEHLMVSNGSLYTFNNRDFTGSSISKLDLASNILDGTDHVTMSSGCGSSALVQERIYYMEYAQNLLNRYDVATNSILDTLQGSPATYGLIDDPDNGVMYGTTTDFFSTGEFHVLTYEGQILSSVAVGPNPGRLALDTRSSTGVSERSIATTTCYPNPTTGLVTLSIDHIVAGQRVVLRDAAGRNVLDEPASTTTVLDLRAIPAGVYAAQVGTAVPVRIVKQ